MPALVAGIHAETLRHAGKRGGVVPLVFLTFTVVAAWMAATSAAMTLERYLLVNPSSEP